MGCWWGWSLSAEAFCSQLGSHYGVIILLSPKPACLTDSPCMSEANKARPKLRMKERWKIFLVLLELGQLLTPPPSLCVSAADMFIIQQIKSFHVFLLPTMNHSAQSLHLAIQVNLGMTHFMVFKGLQTRPDCLVYWTVLCIVYKLKDGMACWGVGQAESTMWPQEPNIASFEHVCNQRKPEKKKLPKSLFGQNLLEMVHDKAASYVYIVKKRSFKSSATKGRTSKE